MGAFQGSLTYRQYRVNEHLPPTWQRRVQDGLIAHLAREIDPNTDGERSSGWCDPQFPLAPSLSLEQCLRQEYLVIGMRVDTLNVPKRLLTLYCEREERRLIRELNQESLTRYERAEVREQVEKALKRKKEGATDFWPKGLIYLSQIGSIFIESAIANILTLPDDLWDRANHPLVVMRQMMAFCFKMKLQSILPSIYRSVAPY